MANQCLISTIVTELLRRNAPVTNTLTDPEDGMYSPSATIRSFHNDMYHICRVPNSSYLIGNLRLGPFHPRTKGLLHGMGFDIMFINCLWYDFYIYDAFEFLCNSIANL